MADTTRYRDDPSIEEAHHDGDGNPVVQTAGANSFLKRPLKILTWITITLITLTIGLLITNNVLLSVWDFQEIYGQFALNRDLAIVLLVTAIVTIPTLFVELPILLNIVIHIIMTTQIFSFAVAFFQWNFPGQRMCSHYEWNGGNWDPTMPTKACLDKLRVMQILMGFAGGVGIFIGSLVIALTVIRLIALFKTQFWRSRPFSGIFSTKAFNNFTGVTVQLSFSIVPSGTLPVVVDSQSSRVVGTTQDSEQERLIET